MRNIKIFLLPIILLFGFLGCEKKISTELHPVHWDRDMCERCKMVVSDRKHTVQVIQTATGKSYMFDDIGCLALWADEEKIAWFPKAKIWITDLNTGEWIDAREALYDGDHITPMAYGFSAHKNTTKIKEKNKYISFDEVYKLILNIEAQKNRKSY